MEIIEAYPDKPLDWESISMNPNIRIEFIEAHPDKHVNWGEISENKFRFDKYLLDKGKKINLDKFRTYILCLNRKNLGNLHP